MKHRILAIIAVLSLVITCGNHQKQSTKEFTTHIVEVAVDSTYALPVWELPISSDTIMFSPQVLTSWERMENAFENGAEGDFLDEPTPATAAFFKKEKDIASSQLALNVQRRYNFAATLGRVVHAYQWFHRLSSELASGDNSKDFTKQDSLEWIKESQPELTYGFLKEALQFPSSYDVLTRMLNAYKKYDGTDGNDTPFAKALADCQKEFTKIPDIVSSETINQFKEEFWGWYDKEQFIPGIDKLIVMNTYRYEGEKITEEQLPQLINAVKRERDIDRRTILALELVKFDSDEGILLLGDILESGIYTRYLLEAWISWRANLQLYYGPSSFSVIPNNYFDMIRVKSLNTFLRHLQEEPDDYRAKVLMENMILTDCMKRMGAFGNESMETTMLLSHKYFIPKRLLPKE